MAIKTYFPSAAQEEEFTLVDFGADSTLVTGTRFMHTNR